MKNILVTGAYGQLGNEVRILSANYPDYNFMFTDVDSLDITDKNELIDFVTGNDIRYIINCAAYTAVDKAEENYELADKINGDGPTNLAKAADTAPIGIDVSWEDGEIDWAQAAAWTGTAHRWQNR